MEAAFGQVLRFTVVPGKEGDFDALAAETMEAVAAIRPGPLIYACHALDGHPRVRVLYEMHADRAAFAAHERRPHAARFRSERAKLVAASEVLGIGLTAGIGLPEGLSGTRPHPSPPGEGTDETIEGTTFGQRVSFLRKRRGLSQRALASIIDRSESWVSQVERDILPVGRLNVLHVLAEALGVSIYQLEPAYLAPPPEESPAVDHGHVAEIERARSVLVGHPGLQGLLADHGLIDDAPAAPAVGRPPDAARLAREVEDAWGFVREARLADLGRALTSVIPAVEEAARRNRPAGDAAPTPGADRGPGSPDGAGTAGFDQLRASAYQVAAAGFAWSDEASAWIAAERAMVSAEQVGDLWGVLAALARMAQGFASRGSSIQAEQVVESALDAMAPLTERDDAAPEALTLAGALHLTGAVVAAREGQRSPARRHIEAARRLASRLGADRAVHGTEFGPTGVDVHSVAVAVELGDAGEALEVAARIDAGQLSAERRARFLVDVARAHSQRRHVEEATTALLEAESTAAELVAAHAPARDAIGQLVQQAGKGASDALRGLADRLLGPPSQAGGSPATA